MNFLKHIARLAAFVALIFVTGCSMTAGPTQGGKLAKAGADGEDMIEITGNWSRKLQQEQFCVTKHAYSDGVEADVDLTAEATENGATYYHRGESDIETHCTFEPRSEEGPSYSNRY